MRIVDPQTDPINMIEAVRNKNNILWMDIMRIAMNHAPEETKKVLQKIRSNDLLISQFIEELANEDIQEDDKSKRSPLYRR